MRLAFVNGSLVHGGAERHAITLANRLAERGHECHMVYAKPDHSQLGRLRLVPPSSVRCLHARRYLDFRALGHLKSFFERSRPHVVVATNPYALMHAALAEPKAPLLVTLHSTYARGLKEQLQMLAYRPLFWAADCAAFVCERQRRHWARRGLFGRRNVVVYNGVDTEHWGLAEKGSRTLFAETDLVIGLCAVLRPEKNPTLLVDAIAMLRRRGIPAKALFIGDGPLRGAVEERAARHGVARDVALTGLVEDVRPWLAQCDAVALTSHTEAFSLSAIEALALGRPVVHADVGGAAEMIRDGENGFLFPGGDAAALAERLAALADPAARARMGRAARACVEERFSERAMIDRYEQLLSELASSRSQHEHLRKRAPAH